MSVRMIVPRAAKIQPYSGNSFADDCDMWREANEVAWEMKYASMQTMWRWLPRDTAKLGAVAWLDLVETLLYEDDTVESNRWALEEIQRLTDAMNGEV